MTDALEKKKSYPPISALMRGLDLLTELNKQKVASVGSLYAATGISKSTIVRNLETFEHLGLVARDQKSDGYVVTAKVLTLSAGYDLGERLVAISTPILNEFRATMPWPSDVAVFDGEAMVILETSRPPGTLALNRPIGTRLPVTRSALGRAYLANINEDRKNAILDSIARTAESVFDRDQIEHDLKRYRLQGYSENNQSLSENTRGVGIAIQLDGEVVACVNSVVLAEAMSMKDVIKRCVTPLRNVARKIETALADDR